MAIQVVLTEPAQKGVLIVNVRQSLTLVAAIAWATAFGPDVARADGYRPPGGVLPLHRGGDNQASFPPLSTVGVEESGTKPVAVSLAVRCYPNPVRGASRFRIRATAGEEVRVRLHSVSGRLVREWREVGAGSGWTEWTWDGRPRTSLPARRWSLPRVPA